MTGSFLDITNHRLAPPADWSDTPDSDHFVQFYETDAYLVNSLRGFIGAGLGAGDAGIVIATASIRRNLEQDLRSDGFDVSALTASGQYVALDSRETLSAFLRDGVPEPESFSVLMGQVIERANVGRPHVRIYGDMVACLWSDGNHVAAIKLEALWNELGRRHGFSLFCGYPASSFAGTALAGPIGEVCAAHTRVIPAESYSGLDSADERLRAIAQLQQKAASLEAEIAERERTALERDQARIEAETQRARLHVLFMQAPALIAVLRGPEHVYELVNPEYVRVVGERNYLGRPVRDVLPESEHQGIIELLDRVYASGESYTDRELPLLLDREGTGSLEERFLDCTLQATRDSRGSVDGIMVHAVDVTELVGARRRIEELSRQKDDFLSAAAHDLKTPLTTIKGVSQLLRRRAARADSVDIARLIEGLEQIDATATRMNRFVGELLDVTRTTMDRPLQLNLRPADLVAVARAAVEECRRLADGHCVTIESSVPAVVGWWDEERLYRVVANLLSNAVKYSPAGGEIAVSVAAEGEGEVRIAVQDHGIGIPAADLPKIFDRFYRASNIDPHVSGTGIGLAGAKQIVERHGGAITVESTEGEGTTFIVRLPVLTDLPEVDPVAAADPD